MAFSKLRNEGNNYHLTSALPFDNTGNLKEYVSEVFDFAYAMTFGGDGQHRGNRSGGQYGRKNGELFINTFQGKLAEFAFFDLYKKNETVINRPDMETWALGVWDSCDFEIDEKHFNIKSTTYRGDLLLLETKDWNNEAIYIPNMDVGVSDYDYFVFIRIKPDGKDIMRSERMMYSNEVDKGELQRLVLSQSWVYDIPGYINRGDLKFLIENEFILPQNALYKGRISMDAENYYCQSGDMRKINELI
jgi:hypothetical protein